MGARVEQLCDARTAGRRRPLVQAAHFVEPALGHAPDAGAVVAASACRAAPAYHGRLVAAVYRSGHQDDLLLVIAAIDSATGQVGASFKGALDSDPVVRIVSGSLWLDAAAYDLAPGVRAFKGCWTSPPGCRAACAVCRRRGAARKPDSVIQGRFITRCCRPCRCRSEELIQRGRSACTDSSAPDQTITENFTATLGLASTSTRGYRDLVVAGGASRDDDRPDGRYSAARRAEVGWPRLLSIGERQRDWTAWKQ